MSSSYYVNIQSSSFFVIVLRHCLTGNRILSPHVLRVGTVSGIDFSSLLLLIECTWAPTSRGLGCSLILANLAWFVSLAEVDLLWPASQGNLLHWGNEVHLALSSATPDQQGVNCWESQLHLLNIFQHYFSNRMEMRTHISANCLSCQ